ncbi:hypothetical protein C8R43DRAFT_902379 [Mycena crocata]|nr:hypothetical protein C8R43DRAFT_902379 [Mycena crocata]
MQKNVHFSDRNLVYSPLPWSPSPNGSVSSLPPSPTTTTSQALPLESGSPIQPQLSPETELPQKPLPSPPPPIYRPPPTVARAQIHLLLSFAPFTPPNVRYDLSHPVHTLNPQLTSSFLEPATYPPLPALTLRCQHLAWPILVFPSQPLGFVSVLDVFTSLYTSLRLAALRAEYAALPLTRQSIDAAYFARCSLQVDDEEQRIEMLKGVKRVDFLCGKTHFLGLSGPLDEANQVWELNVA